ncbi:MAG: tetratricopeptide repeat protein [Clostridiales bacterium]|nr:tetratricopeptide repeat protein [Clostridiales bacterium]
MKKGDITEFICNHIEHGRYSSAVLLCDNSPFGAINDGVRQLCKGVALFIADKVNAPLPPPYNMLSSEGIARIVKSCLLRSAEVYGIEESRYNLEVLRCKLFDKSGITKPSFVRVNGVSAYLNGDVSTAIGLLLAETLVNPLDFAAHTDMGVAYISIGEYSLAEEHLNAVLEVRPGDVTALYNMGRVYILTQRFEEARSVLVRALRERPRDEEILYLLGEAELNLGNYSSARVMFSRAITDKNEFVSQSAAKRILFINDVTEDTKAPGLKDAMKICSGRYKAQYSI